MATIKDVNRTPSGRITYRGESFSGFNKPKRTPKASKKSAVLAKKGDEIKIVRFGDQNMTIKKDQPARKKSFRARHSCDTAKDKFTARYFMKEFKDGKLKSGSGKKVTNLNQAMAIAMSEAGINKRMFSGGNTGDGKAVQGRTQGRNV